VAQSVDGDVLTFTWDLASPLAQVVATSDGVVNLYSLVQIGEKRDGEWAYSLGEMAKGCR
jgi:hypothetical protein